MRTSWYIGVLGKTLGDNDVNIASFTLGRSQAGGQAIALLYVDNPISDTVIGALKATGVFGQAKINFPIENPNS